MVEPVIIGRATLYLGDCRDILPTLSSVDVLVTDPPYGLDLGTQADMRGGAHGLAKGGYGSYDDTLDNYRAVVVPAVKAALAAAKRGAVFSNHNLHELPKPDAIGGVFLPAATGRHCWGFNSLSPIAYYGKAPGLEKGSRASAISSTETAEINGHPCPKPLGWMQWLIRHAARAGETVLDPFMGSGTTGVAAILEKCSFVGIECDPAYFEIACDRMRRVTGIDAGPLFGRAA